MAKCALMTITYNEPDFLKMWYGYYSRFFKPCDIYVMDDGSDPKYTDGINANFEPIGQKHLHGGIKRTDDVHIHHSIKRKFVELLKSYQYVLHADTDEFVVPDPEVYPEGLGQFIDDVTEPFVQCSGYDILDTTGEPLDIESKPWLAQRKHWHRNWSHYCKVLLARVDPQWKGGLHDSRWTTQQKSEFGEHENEDFRLLHMHYACSELTHRRWQARSPAGDQRFPPNAAADACRGVATSDKFPKEDIPDRWRMAL